MSTAGCGVSLPSLPSSPSLSLVFWGWKNLTKGTIDLDLGRGEYRHPKKWEGYARGLSLPAVQS